MEKSRTPGRLAAIVAYLTIIGTIIAYFMNNEQKTAFAAFHIRQALGVHILFYILGLIVSSFDSWMISSAFYVFIFILWGYGIVSAIQYQRHEVPVLGKQFQKWFSTIQ